MQKNARRIATSIARVARTERPNRCHIGLKTTRSLSILAVPSVRAPSPSRDHPDLGIADGAPLARALEPKDNKCKFNVLRAKRQALFNLRQGKNIDNGLTMFHCAAGIQGASG